MQKPTADHILSLLNGFFRSSLYVSCPGIHVYRDELTQVFFLVLFLVTSSIDRFAFAGDLLK